MWGLSWTISSISMIMKGNSFRISYSGIDLRLALSELVDLQGEEVGNDPDLHTHTCTDPHVQTNKHKHERGEHE